MVDRVGKGFPQMNANKRKSVSFILLCARLARNAEYIETIFVWVG